MTQTHEDKAREIASEICEQSIRMMKTHRLTQAEALLHLLPAALLAAEQRGIERAAEIVADFPFDGEDKSAADVVRRDLEIFSAIRSLSPKAEG